MKLLQTWVATPLAGAVGWTLVHSLWEGAAVSVALAALLVAVRSPRVRYAAACLAMLLMLAGFGITLIHLMPESEDGLQTTKRVAFPAWNVSDYANATNASDAGLAAAIPWLAPLWIAGVWIFCLRHVAGWISVRGLRQRGVCSAPEHWQKELVRLRARLRLSRPVALLESCLADAPAVLGHFRPVILMPVGLFAGLPPEQIEAILLHELSHIRRYDYLVNVLQRSVEGLLFYHPAAWWISGVIRAERENCCDDVVVATTGNPHEYAVALAALEENRWPGREAVVAATGGSLVKRIRRLLYPKAATGVWTPLAAAAILIGTAAMALTAWQSQPPQQSPAVQQQTERADASVYARWLNQEVVYIIADEERAAFLGLRTDEERNQFIEQFWLRRDPTPDTVENEFKTEHYRRIAYANERFRTQSGRPGWQTDRGHMYIVYGPPDEIEDHSKGGPTPYPFQVWKYAYLEGVGENLSVTFVDRTGRGDYQLAPGGAR